VICVCGACVVGVVRVCGCKCVWCVWCVSVVSSVCLCGVWCVFV